MIDLAIHLYQCFYVGCIFHPLTFSTASAQPRGGPGSPRAVYQHHGCRVVGVAALRGHPGPGGHRTFRLRRRRGKRNYTGLWGLAVYLKLHWHALNLITDDGVVLAT